MAILQLSLYSTPQRGDNKAARRSVGVGSGVDLAQLDWER